MRGGKRCLGPKKLFIDTYGCRTNLADSSEIASLLVSNGFELVSQSKDAEVVIVNSCTVTANADRDTGKALRRARRSAPTALLVLTGCLPTAQPDHAVLRLADLVIPGFDPAALTQALTRPTLHPEQDEAGPPPPPSQPVTPVNQGKPLGERTKPETNEESYDIASLSAFPLERARNLSRATIRIQHGCDGTCSYCIVPAARGRPTSRDPQQVLAAIRRAQEAGFPEVVLCGTHLAKYGIDLPGGWTLPRLMDAIEESRPACRVRISSLEAAEGITDVIERLGRSSVWCRHVHLAIQHTEDELLKRMGRSYGFDQIRAWAGTVLAIPGMCLGLDVMVGFPGETPERFEKAYQRLESLPFAYLHVFAFSPRPGTLAAAWEPPLREEVRRRSARLRSLSQQRRGEFAGSMVGRTLPVVVENRRERAKGRLIGLADNYLRVYLHGPDTLMGKSVKCRVTGIEGSCLQGEVGDIH